MKIKRSQFDALVEEALAELPPVFARWLEVVPVIVEDEPSEELLRDMGMEGEDLLGSYHGVAITRKSVEDSGHLPDQIMIFRRPLIRMCKDMEELRAEVRKTVLHELGHYAGFDEEELEGMGYG